MKYDLQTNIWNKFLIGNGMSQTVTWVFGLAACTGLYNIQILFGNDKDQFDTCRIQGSLH